MEQGWIRLLIGLVCGLSLPALCLAAGARLGSKQSPPPLFTQQESTRVTESISEEIETQVFLPVLRGECMVVMELESYIRGVVLAEMPANFDSEALKAQAVAARTYALKHMQAGDNHSFGGVCTDSACCQAYISDEDYLSTRGKESDLQRVAQAVADTAGQVLMYGSELIEATYFACSGGKTEDAQAVWGAQVPYLQSVESPGEEGSVYYSREVRISPEAFAAALGRSLTGNPKNWFGKLTRTQGGGVETLVIGGVSYTGSQLRKLLGLASTAFTLSVTDGEICIVTAGRGHRVGLSQYGAEAMAVSGKGYIEILFHYYPGTRIDKLGAME